MLRQRPRSERSSNQRTNKRLQLESLEGRRLLAADVTATIDVPVLIAPEPVPVPVHGAILGTKWEDFNGNGRRDANEPGLAGVTIYIDANQNSSLDPGELSTVTQEDDPTTRFDEGGRYAFSKIRPGEHLVREVVPNGYQQTFPRSLTPVDSVSQDDAADEDVFASAIPDSLHYELEDGDLVIDGVGLVIHPFCVVPVNVGIVVDEPGIGFKDFTGVQTNGCGGDTSKFEIGIEGDGRPHRFDLWFVDSGGHKLDNIPVTISVPSHAGGHFVKVGLAQTVDGIDFGNQPKNGAIHGRKWHDTNGNGQHDDHEPGLGGVTIYIDANLNEQLDRGERLTRTMEDDPDTDYDESGRYWLSNVNPGQHVVREIVPDGYEQTFPPFLIVDPLPNPDGTFPDVPQGRFHWVTIWPGETITDVDFGNKLVPATGGISGIKWLDINGNAQRDRREPGVAGVTIYLDNNNNRRLDDGEPSTVTAVDNPATAADETGQYRFGNLAPGNYSVREVVPEGSLQTYPQVILFDSLPPLGPVENGASHYVRVRAGQVVENIDFGNQIAIPGVASGTKWLDRNGDGIRQGNEPGLADVTVYSDLNFNARLDPGEPRAVTSSDDPATDFDEGGRYVLTDLRPGYHAIREVVPEGYVQTFPRLSPTIAPVDPNSTDQHVIYLGSGQSIEGIDFGNQRTTGAITGTKWWDQNRNGKREHSEPGIADVVIFLDTNNNNILDDGEISTTTAADNPATVRDETGFYRFGNLPSGDYRVREILPPYTSQSFPGDVVVRNLVTHDLEPGRAIDLRLDTVRTVHGNDNNGTGAIDLIFELEWPDGCHEIVANQTTHSLPNGTIQVNMYAVNFDGPCTEAITTDRVLVHVDGLSDTEYPVQAFLHESKKSVDSDGFHRSFTLDADIQFVGTAAQRVWLGVGQTVNGVDFGNSTWPFGDVDGDRDVDVDDIDRLNMARRNGSTNLKFDLSADGIVNMPDLDVMVKNVLHTSYGDADLDGFFDSSDLVLVFQAGEYEDGVAGNSTWAEGDWNGDGEFDSGDLVLAFRDGGYVRHATASLMASAVDTLFADILNSKSQRMKTSRPTSALFLA